VRARRETGEARATRALDSSTRCAVRSFAAPSLALARVPSPLLPAHQNNDGFIDPSELEIVARCFNTAANVDQEIKVIFSKLDKNRDGMINLREWVSVLFDLFRFMSAGAFDKHCEELLALLKKAHPDGVHHPPATAAQTANAVA
jgi:hypothetical protein